VRLEGAVAAQVIGVWGMADDRNDGLSVYTPLGYNLAGAGFGKTRTECRYEKGSNQRRNNTSGMFMILSVKAHAFPPTTIPNGKFSRFRK
jgi:hypothetical protein